MFLTLKNEKTLKKMRSKTLKNNIFFILGRNLIIRSFEISHSIWKLHKDFKSVFAFKFRQKTKKFTPKWQKPLFEKRVDVSSVYYCITGQYALVNLRDQSFERMWIDKQKKALHLLNPSSLSS